MRPEDTALAGGDDVASVNDGDQAFPLVAHEDWKQIHYGMSLRDYFAAKAAQGLIAQSEGHALHSDPDVGAKYAYAFADALLRARGR